MEMAPKVVRRMAVHGLRRIVISTGAQRSGGICGFSSNSHAPSLAPEASSILIFRPPRWPHIIEDRRHNALNLEQKLWIGGTAQQLQASLHLVSVRHADQCARYVRVAQA